MLNLVFSFHPLPQSIIFLLNDLIPFITVDFSLNTLHCSHMENSVLFGYSKKENQESCE